MSSKNTIPSVRMDNRFDKDKKFKSLNAIRKIYNKTCLDSSFQRNGGIERGSGWAAETGRGYLREVLTGAVFNKIILADVERCRQWAHEIKDLESIAYFDKRTEEGYEYVSIDGNNSSSMIAGFLENHEELYFDDGKGNKKYFKDFTTDECEDILNEKVLEVVFLRRITITEMCKLFRMLNKSTQLNDQERRQARITELSKYVRDSANKAKSKQMIKKFVYPKKEHLDKRFHEELQAQLCLKYTKKFNTNLIAKNLDRYYELSMSLDSSVKKQVDEVHDVLGKMLDATQSFKGRKRLTKGKYHALCDVIHIILSQGYSIEKPKEILAWFLEVDATAVAVAESLTEAEKDNSYIHWIKTYQKKDCYSHSRQLFSDKLAISSGQLEAAGTILKKRTSQNNFDSSVTPIRLWVAQGHKDRSDNQIDILDIYMGKCHVDHVKSVRDGGTNAYANAELMSASDNLSKGPNSNLPKFSHQKTTDLITTRPSSQEYAFDEDNLSPNR